MESGIEASSPSSSSTKASTENIVVLDSPSVMSSALMDSTKGLSVSTGSLSLCSSTLPSTLSSTMPSSLSSSDVLNSTTGSSQARAIDTLVSESLVTLECNVGRGSPISDNLATVNLPGSAQQPQESQTPDVNKLQTMPTEVATEFVSSLGAWKKPLFFKPPATPPEPGTPRNYDPAVVGNQLAALWPLLNDEILNKKPKGKQPICTLQPPVEKLPPPELKSDGTLRFSWAARLSPQSRNLYRAATPTYRLDGTPEVSIPSKVLKLGPENKDEYIIGKFHKCSLPPGGLVHAVVNRIWGRSCKISCKKIGESSFMFHIPHEPTRHWVIQRGVWHIDDCLLFVLPWTLEGSFKIPEISTLPVWVTLKNIPDCCYSRLGLSHVASGLGEPILTHKPRLDPTSMGEAKVLVEMELDKDFPKLIALDDKQGSIFLVNVEYTWIPSMCERCGNLGHKAKRCLLSSKPTNDPTLPQQTKDVRTDIRVVDIDLILQQGDSSSSPLSPIHPKAKEKVLISTLESGARATQSITNQAVTVHIPALPNVEAVHDSPLGHSVALEVHHGTKTPIFGTLPSSSHSPQEKPVDPLNSVTTLSTLVDSRSAPIDSLIMESSPSTVINNEVLESFVVDPSTTTPNHCTFESPSRFTVLGNVDEVEIEPSSSLSLTRGGRESKPPSTKTWNGRQFEGEENVVVAAVSPITKYYLPYH
ncbi:hypothetical protein N665_0223s0018 [Sinapis alba]|nr:hypothetical protein N665_0223s0018 [Sinapis alba]